MTRHRLIALVINRQLEQHGYHLTDAELKDVAAQVVMVIADEIDDAIIRAHSSPRSYAALMAREARNADAPKVTTANESWTAHGEVQP